MPRRSLATRHSAAVRALAAVALTGLTCTACSTASTSSTASSTPAPSTWFSSPLPTGTTEPPATTPPAATPTPALRPTAFAFPIEARSSFGRAHHHYPATDIFAACGSPVVAPADGTVQELRRTDVWDRSVNDGATRGGLSFTILGVQGVRYYGSHLRSISKGIEVGGVVRAGEVIGTVGRTGDAVGVACHLHFGISPDCGPGDWWTRRGTVSPYRYLRAWQRGETLSPAGAVKAWKAENGCPATRPKGY
jgi:peptidoglycan LD-endopeptidase LytH